MTPPVARLAAAELAAADAKSRLSRDVADLQSRLDPKALARVAAEQGREVGLVGVEKARRNPALVGGIGVAVALLLFRRPLRRLLRPRHRVYAAPRSSN